MIYLLGSFRIIIGIIGIRHHLDIFFVDSTGIQISWKRVEKMDLATKRSNLKAEKIQIAC